MTGAVDLLKAMLADTVRLPGASCVGRRNPKQFGVVRRDRALPDRYRFTMCQQAMVIAIRSRQRPPDLSRWC